MIALRYILLLGAVGLGAAVAGCGSLERANPADPAGQAADPQAGLSLVVPLPKPLISVVDSIVVTLQGPTIPTIVMEMEHSPQGPATLTIGALAPGSGFRLTVLGYDHAGVLLLRGEQDGIAI
ncbi:MAG: hypothetical protein ABIL09_17145, partial [Gemmatimonadota bacterium]